MENKPISEILKELRISKSLRQSDVAEILGISQPAYQKYELGKAEPNATGYRKLADFYGVTTDYLLGREPLQFSNEEIELITKYKKLDNIGKRSVNNIINSEVDRQNAVALFREYIDNREKYGAEKAAEMLNDKISKKFDN